jgi:sugar (pentulose or hexulose) kinase
MGRKSSSTTLDHGHKSYIAAEKRLVGTGSARLDQCRGAGARRSRGRDTSCRCHRHRPLRADARRDAARCNNEVIRPSILWNDTRSEAEAAEMDAHPSWRAISGNIVFPGFTAPKLAWMRRHEPRLFDKTRKILLPKDYLRFWLSGEHVSEMSDAAGTSWLDTGTRDWSDELLEASGLSRNHMPRLVEGSEISAELRPELASRWGLRKRVVVAGGAGDNAASAVGAGLIRASEGSGPPA